MPTGASVDAGAPRLTLTHIVLYQNGLAHVTRRGAAAGGTLELHVPALDMDHIVKSLTMIQRGAGSVTAVRFPAYELPTGLAGDRDERSLRALLWSLRGHTVQLMVAPADKSRPRTGRLIGIEESAREGDSLVMLSTDGTIRTLQLSQVASVRVLDSFAADELTYALDVAAAARAARTVTIDVSGELDLEVRYNVSANPWRATYRLIAETHGETDAGQLLLQGWAVVDNTTREAWEQVRLTLIAGETKVVEESVYEWLTEWRAPLPDEEAPRMQRGAKMEARPVAAVPVQTRDMSELFEYVLEQPVTVQAGQTAFIPFLSATMSYSRELIYDMRHRQESHPTASLRFSNNSPYTLESGTVVLIENGVYKGEARLPLTRPNSEITVPYAVEKSITVTQQTLRRTAEGQVHIGGRREPRDNSADPVLGWHETVDILSTRLLIDNQTDGERALTLEAEPLQARQTFDGDAQPVHQDAALARWRVTLPARHTTTFVIERRTAKSSRLTLSGMTLPRLEQMAKASLLDETTLTKLREILDLETKQRLYGEQQALLSREGETLRVANEDLRKTMSVLLASDDVLRAEVLNRLTTNTRRLQALAEEGQALQRRLDAGKRRLRQLISQLYE